MPFLIHEIQRSRRRLSAVGIQGNGCAFVGRWDYERKTQQRDVSFIVKVDKASLLPVGLSDAH